MPTENETKPCGVTGCPGTMTFRQRAVPPGGNTSFAHEDGARQLIEPRPGWVCDKTHEHVQTHEGYLEQLKGRIMAVLDTATSPVYDTDVDG